MTLTNTDTTIRDLRPINRCPRWRGGFHPWRPDGDEYFRNHYSGNRKPGAAWTTRLITVDAWFAGKFERCALCENGEPAMGAAEALRGLT